MVTFLQRTFTSLVHAHAGRTQFIQADAASRRGLIPALAYGGFRGISRDAIRTHQV